MAKRLRVEFKQAEGSTKVAEEGQPRQCATGVHWVNADTLKTLAKRHIRRTDAKGRPLDESAAKRSTEA